MVVPALLKVLGNIAPSVQAIVTTHSPLVMASIEPEFDVNVDKLFLFELERAAVALREVPWAKQGDVIGWLTSDIFGLKQGRSIQGEEAIEAAEAFMRNDRRQLREGLRTKAAIDKALHAHLANIDPFWPRWVAQDRG